MNSCKYKGTLLKSGFSIKKFYTIHYFQYSRDFCFDGECHDFWEMVYVDKGEAEIGTEKNSFMLMGGEAFFHSPGQWHSLKTDGINAPDIIVLSFECTSGWMDFFSEKIVNFTNDEKKILGHIVKEAKDAFEEPLGDPLSKKLIRKKGNDTEAEQMIKLLTEQLFISLKRNYFLRFKDNSLLKERFDDDIVDSTLEFLENNIGIKLKFEDVLRNAGTGSTNLKKLFSKRMGCGVMDYFSLLKIERAKRYIREDNYNFTQISSLLGYDSLHYFSKQFKKKTGMTPTEYANSVRIIIDKI